MIQKIWRGNLARRKFESFATCRRKEIYEKKKERFALEQRHKRSRLKKSINLFVKMANKFKEDWMFKLIQLMKDNQNDDGRVFRSINHRGIDPKHINVKYLQPIGIKMTRDDVFDLLNYEKVSHEKQLSAETFLVWLMKVRKHQPNFFLAKIEMQSRKSNTTDDEMKKRMKKQSVLAVGYQKLKW
eukprot:g961.t1